MNIVLCNNHIPITTDFTILHTRWMNEFFNYHTYGVLFYSLREYLVGASQNTLKKLSEKLTKV